MDSQPVPTEDQSQSGFWSVLNKYWKPVIAVLAVAALVYFMCFHWSRFLADFWPFDASRVGPNLVASLVQWALIVIVVTLLYPPLRRAAERFAARHIDRGIEAINHHVSSEHKKLHAKLDHAHAQMDHIIKHSKNIPDFPAFQEIEHATPQ